MLRRKFLGIVVIVIAGVGLMGLLSFNTSIFRKIYDKIRYGLLPPPEVKPDSERLVATLPSEGMRTSVETALNSRCTSDYDGNPKMFHWGMFDPANRLSDEQIQRITNLIKIPRFTDWKMQPQIKGNTLLFAIDNRSADIQRHWLMVENGMQQQAAALVCAALGVGMVFSSLGNNRVAVAENEDATIKIKLDPMKPSYEGSYWSDHPPLGRKSWLNGNLPNPVRNGKQPLLETLDSLGTHHSGRNSLSEQSLSQLLWAARGRTPHYYKSEPWGMTIPTSQGEQNNTGIYVMTNSRIRQYVNWSSGMATHSLKETGEVSRASRDSITHLFPNKKYFIVITRNEDIDKAYWETGYQLLNILLQAKSLDISYRALLLNEEQIKTFQMTGVENPVAAVML